MARAALSWFRNHQWERKKCKVISHKFIVFDVQENELGPKMRFLCGSDDLVYI